MQVALVDQQVPDAVPPAQVRVVPLERLLELVPCEGEARLHGHLADLLLVDDGGGAPELLPHVALPRADGVGDLAEGLREGDHQGLFGVDLLLLLVSVIGAKIDRRKGEKV